MKILYTTPTMLPSRNGVVTRLIETLHVLHGAGDEVLVVAPSLPGSPATIEGYPLLGLPSLPLPTYPGFRVGLPLLFAALRQVVERFRPEIVHALDPVAGTGWVAHVVAHRCAIPLITSYHTHLAQYMRLYAPLLEEPTWTYLRAMHRGAVQTWCPSKTAQDVLGAHGIAAQALWPGGVDLARFHPDKRSLFWRARLTQGHPTSPLLLYVGRIAREKHIDLLLESVASLRESCSLALVGDGPALPYFLRQARSLPRVTFFGRLTGDDLAQAYASADVFCMPSSTETFGNVTVEAMASGLPVVGVAAGGMLDLVSDGQTGLLSSQDHPLAFASLIQQLIDDCELRARLSQAARRAAECYGWEYVTGMLRERYQAQLALSQQEVVV